MAKKQLQQDDPWSGFVDVLSNVVMVVTFIVIILGIAMFALSQQIAKNIAKKIIEAKCAAPGEDGGDLKQLLAAVKDTPKTAEAQLSKMQVKDAAPEESSAKGQEGAQQAEAQPQEQAENQEKQQQDQEQESSTQTSEQAAPDSTEQKDLKSQAKSGAGERDVIAEDVGEDASEGNFRATRGRPKLLEDEIEGKQDLTVRAREVEQEDVDSVVAEERQIKETGDIADARDALLKIKFGVASYKLTEEAIAAMKERIQSDDLPKDAVFEVRAIALSKIGSISEARRLGFYRAMAARTALLQLGVPKANIITKMRESGSMKEADHVYIFLKK